jgi:hypothetical protein
MYKVPDLPDVLPSSPTDDELYHFPLKFKYSTLSSEKMCLTQTTYAGREYMDPNGRYGNFVAHSVVLDKRPDLYPIEYYDAPFFRKTMSFDEVNSDSAPLPLASIVLTADDNRLVSMSSVRSFVMLQDPEHLKNMVYMTLDAITEQRPFCFSSADVRSIPFWIGAVSMLFPKELIIDLTFSTYEYDPQQETTTKLNGCWIEGTRFRDTSYPGFVLTPRKINRNSPDNPEFSDYIETAYFEESKRDGFHEFVNNIKWTEFSRRIISVYNLYIIRTIGANHLKEDVIDECIKILKETYSKMDTSTLEAIASAILSSDKCNDDTFRFISADVFGLIRSSKDVSVAIGNKATERLLGVNTFDGLRAVEMYFSAFADGIKKGHVETRNTMFPSAVYVILSHLKKNPEDSYLRDSVKTIQDGLSAENISTLASIISADTSNLSEYTLGDYPLNGRLRNLLDDTLTRNLNRLSADELIKIVRNAMDRKKYDEAASFCGKCLEHKDFEQFIKEYLRLVGSLTDMTYETRALESCIEYAKGHRRFFAFLFKYLKEHGAKPTDKIFGRCVTAFHEVLDLKLLPTPEDASAFAAIMSICGNNPEKIPDGVRSGRIVVGEMGMTLANGFVPQRTLTEPVVTGDESVLDDLCGWIFRGGVNKKADHKWFMYYLDAFRKYPKYAVAPAFNLINDMELEQIADYIGAIVLSKYAEPDVKNGFSAIGRLKEKEISKIGKIMEKFNEPSVKAAVEKYIIGGVPKPDVKMSGKDSGKKDEYPKKETERMDRGREEPSKEQKKGWGFFKR